MKKLDRLVPYSKKRYEKMRQAVAEAVHPELPLKAQTTSVRKKRRYRGKQLKFWD